MRKKLYSIETMIKKILELLILSVLFISPLIHVSIEDWSQSRTMWSWLILITAILIVFFLAYPFRVRNIFSQFLWPLGTVGISSFFVAIYPAHAFAIYLAVLALLLFLALQYIVSTDRANKLIFSVVLISAIALYAQWGIAQFIVQHDLGMKRIGESVLTVNTPGVASFYVGSEKFIRAYGPFGHANSFAGVLLLGIILLYNYRDKLQSPLFFHSIFFILSLSIIVSFSRTALLGLLLVGFLFIYNGKRLLLVAVAISALFFAPLVFNRSIDTHGVAANDRLAGLEWLIDMTTVQSSIRGLGLGNYTTALGKYLQDNSIAHDPWDIAPIHSVPLLLLAELGLVMSIPLFFFLIRYMVTRKAWILIALLPALLFDHYFATQFAPLIFLITTAHIVV